MFSAGSKFLLGLSGLAGASALVYAYTVNPSDLGAIALIGVCILGAFLAGVNLHNHSGDAATAAEALPAGTDAPRDSAWPAVFALGAGLVLVGLATVPVVFLLGLVVLLAGGAEWLVMNWADRASADRRHNNDHVRVKTLGPLEYPVAAAVSLGVIAYLFSRVMLNQSKNAGTVLFIAIGSVIVTVAFLVGFGRVKRGRALSAVLVLGAAALVVAGVLTGIAGERSELAEASKGHFYEAEHRECGAEEGEHYDHNAGNTVSHRASVLATVTVSGGKVHAQAMGIPAAVGEITVPRSMYANILFRNLDETEHRMVVHLGEETVAETGVIEKVGTCTQLAGRNQEQLLTLRITKPSGASKDGYSIEVPGAEGEVKVIVP